MYTWPMFNPFFFSKVLFDKPVMMHNPMLFAGVLLMRPFGMGLAMMMPFSPMLDFRTAKTKEPA